MTEESSAAKIANMNIKTAASLRTEMAKMVEDYNSYMTAERTHDSNFLTAAVAAAADEVQIRSRFEAINQKCLQAIDLATKAKPNLTQNPEINPDAVISDAYYYMGQAYRIRKKLPEAKAQLIKSFETYPNADALYFTGVILAEEGQKLESKAAFQKVVTDFPDSERAIEANKKVTAPDTSSSGCFVATACFGSYSAPEVIALRQFRDAHLINTRLGRILVDHYYKFGPSAAGVLSRHGWMKNLVRKLVLRPIVKSVQVIWNNGGKHNGTSI